MTHVSGSSTQRGVALVVAMVILVAVTVVSLSSLTVSLLEVRMAENEEARMVAFQEAQAGVEAITPTIDSFAVLGGVGSANCTPDSADSSRPDPLPALGCNVPDIILPTEFDSRTSVMIRRLSPETQCPPEFLETSCSGFGIASYGIVSNYDDTANRGGRSTITQGFAVLLPSLNP